MKHPRYLPALAAASLLAACSLGPPDLSPVLSEPPEGRRAWHVFEFGGEGSRSYASEEEPQDPANPRLGVPMNYLELVGRWSWLMRRGGWVAAPFLANGGMAPGLGAGYALPRLYAAGFVSAHWWDPASPGFSAQAGARLGGNWSLRLDNYPVRYFAGLDFLDGDLHREAARITRASLIYRAPRGEAGGVAFSPHALWNHTRGFPGGGVTVVVHLPAASGPRTR